MGMRVILFMFLACVVVSVGASAQTATTTADPEIPTSNLKVVLRPLTLAELEVEWAAWQSLLQQKIVEVGAVEIELHALEEEAAASDQPDAPASPEVESLITQLGDLRTEETGLIKRAATVLDDMEKKGGDIAEADAYLDAVSALDDSISTSSVMTAVGSRLSAWFVSDEGGIYWFKRALVAALILLVFKIISGITGRAVVKALDRNAAVSDLLTNFARRTSGGLIFLIGVLVALATLGVPITPLAAALGGGGFIIGFALQETLGNFASGLLIMVYRPFDVGDYVNVAGVGGTVKQMSLVSTTLTTIDNKLLVIPNKTVWGETITNYTGNALRRVDLIFGIGYGDNIQQAFEVLTETVNKHECVLSDPPLELTVGSLGDSCVNISCRPWVKTPDYWKVYWDLTREVKEAFDAAGINIPFPQRDVHVHTVSPTD
jgi:small conductance mechanosensitive channel